MDLRQSFSDQLDRELISEGGDVDQDSSFFALANFNRPSEQSIEINRKANRMLQAAKTLQNRFSTLPTMYQAIPSSQMNYSIHQLALKQNQYRQTDRSSSAGQAEDVLVGRTWSVTRRASTEQLTELATVLAAVRCFTWAVLAQHTDVFCHRITLMVGGQFEIK